MIVQQCLRIHELNRFHYTSKGSMHNVVGTHTFISGYLDVDECQGANSLASSEIM